MAVHRRSATSAVLGGLLLVGTAGCSEGAASAVPLDRATGAVLADAADRLADALEDGDACRAVLEAQALRERAARALEEGDAPESVVVETTRIADATTADLSCDEAADAAGTAGDDASDGDDDGDSSVASDGTPPADDPDDPPPPADEADTDEGRRDDLPGEAKGRDGKGPPNGQGKGRGNG